MSDGPQGATGGRPEEWAARAAQPGQGAAGADGTRPAWGGPPAPAQGQDPWGQQPVPDGGQNPWSQPPSAASAPQPPSAPSAAQPWSAASAAQPPSAASAAQPPAAGSAPQYGSPPGPPQGGQPTWGPQGQQQGQPQGQPQWQQPGSQTPWHPAQTGPGSAAPGGAAPATVDVRAQLSALGIVNPLGALGVAGAAYVVGIVVSVIVLVSGLIGVFISSPQDSLGGGSDPLGGGATGDGPGTFAVLRGIVGLPAQMVASSTFGSYDVQLQLGFMGQAGLSMRLLPGLVTVVIVLTAFLGGRLLRRRQSGAKILGMAISSVLGGLVMAILTVAVAGIFSFSVHEGEYGVVMHAVGVDAFFGAWFLVGAGLLLGQVSGGPRPSWSTRVADAFAALRLAAVHSVAYAVIVGALLLIAGVIWRGTEGDLSESIGLIFFLPWGLGQAFAYIVSLGMFGTGRLEATSSTVMGGRGTADARWFSMFDLPWYLWAAMIIVGLVLLVVAGVLWGHGRTVRPGDLVSTIVSWAALPVGYFVAAFALLILGQASIHGGAEAASVDGSLWIGPWVPLLAGVLGLLVEVLSRLLTPMVGQLVPASLVGWFRRKQEPVEGGIVPSLIPAAVAGAGRQAAYPGAPWQGSPQAPGAGAPWQQGPPSAGQPGAYPGAQPDRHPAQQPNAHPGPQPSAYPAQQPKAHPVPQPSPYAAPQQQQPAPPQQPGPQGGGPYDYPSPPPPGAPQG